MVCFLIDNKPYPMTSFSQTLRFTFCTC